MPQQRRPAAARDALIVVLLGLALAGALEGAARLAGFGDDPGAAIPAKQTGSTRIVAIGGSTVQGVPEGAFGFTTQLALGLSELAPDGDVELLNLARSGRDSDFVRVAFEDAIEAEADLVIVLTGHNEFFEPRRRGGLAGALQRTRDRSALVAASTAALQGLGFAGRDPLPERIEPIHRSGAIFRETLERYRANLAAIATGARARGVPLVLCTAPANLADWPPVHDALGWTHANPDYDEVVRSLEADLAAGRDVAVIAEVERQRAAHGEDAMLVYLEARARRALGQIERARALFDRAKELDPLPLRALDALNAAVRDQQGDGVQVVDVERLFRERSSDGLVGFSLVCDNCHPTPRGNALIAWAIARSLAREGWVLREDVDVGTPDEWLARARRRLGGPEALARAQLRWLLSNALYAMKTPFLHYAASRTYLEQARLLAPDDWRVWGNLATLDLLAGDTRNGRRALVRAAKIRGRALDPDDRANLPYLREALERSGSSADGADRS